MTTNKAMDINPAGIVATRWQDVPPRKLPHPGFSTRLLWTGDNGRKALIFEISPGSVYPELDVHAPGAEEVFVVSGTFIHHPAGSSHIPPSTEGCVLFVFFPEG